METPHRRVGLRSSAAPSLVLRMIGGRRRYIIMSLSATQEPLVVDRESLESSARAESLFRAHQQSIYRQTDRMFAYLMAAQWVAGIAFALWVAPRTWSGSSSQIHVHVWAAVIIGGLVSVFPAALALWRPGAA